MLFSEIRNTKINCVTIRNSVIVLNNVNLSALKLYETKVINVRRTTCVFCKYGYILE